MFDSLGGKRSGVIDRLRFKPGITGAPGDITEATMHVRYTFLASALMALTVAARGEGEGTRGGPVARWGFDEGRGTIVHDSSGNGHNIDLVGSAGLGWNRGVVGRSLAFGRGSRGPSMHVGNQLLPASHLWSVSVWIKTVQPNGTIFFAGLPQGDRWAMRVQGGRAVFEVSMGQPDGWLTRSMKNVADGRWHHLVGVRTAVRQIALYVDGAHQQTLDTRSGSSVSTGGATFTLGSFGGSDPFVGFIDELAMYRRAFSAAEVRGFIVDAYRKSGASAGGGATGPSLVSTAVSAASAAVDIDALAASLGETPSISDMLAVIKLSREKAGGASGRTTTSRATASARPTAAISATVYWLMADNMDIYQNGKPLRSYTPSFRTRRDEARKTSAFSADIALRPGDVFTVGGRRGGSFGGTVVVVDKNNALVWYSNVSDWRVYEPADPERWYLPRVAMRSRQSPVRVAHSFGYQARMRRDYDDKPRSIWGNKDQRIVYMVGVYRQPRAGPKPRR